MVSQPKEPHKGKLYEDFSSLGKISAILSHLLKYSHEIVLLTSRKSLYLFHNFVKERSPFLLLLLLLL